MLNPVAFSCYKNLNLQKCEDSERTESRKPGKQTKGGFDLARQKDENREKAKQLFLDSDGLMKNTEIAEALGIDSAKVRKWKCVDKWNDALENKPKKRGGQKGNKNAKGHGAPVRNKNAETHGAYSKVYFDELSEDEKALIESVTLDTGENTLRELQSLIAKEKDLEKRIKELNTDTTGNLYTDKVEWKEHFNEGRYVAKYPNRKVRGFHFNSLASTFFGWDKIVKGFIEADQALKKGNIELMKSWVNTELGQTWEEQGEKASKDDLLKRRERYRWIVETTHRQQ